MHPDKKHEYEALDAIRGIAAVIVMTAHFFQFTGDDRFFNANATVDLFFILSGFVLLHSYGERLRTRLTPMSYIRKRAVRLYPMLLLGLSLGTTACILITIFGLAHVSTKLLAGGFIANAFFLPYPNNGTIVHQAESITGAIFPADFPLWSLCFEMLASLLFIFLYRQSTLKLGVIAAGSLLIFALLSFTVFGDNAPGWLTPNAIGGVPRVLYGFCLGMILYRCHERLPVRFKASGLTVHAPFLYLFLILPPLLPLYIKGFYFYALILTWAPLGVLWGGAIRPQTGLNGKVARFLGRISYPLYCLHVPVFGLMSLALAPWSVSNGMLIAAAAAASLAASFLSVRWFDEPARRYLGGLGVSIRQRPFTDLENNLNKSLPIGN